MFDRINQVIGYYLDTLKQVTRGGIWVILLLYALINVVVLYAHFDFLSPLFYSAMTFWTGLFGQNSAEIFTHYPGHFLVMPFYFGLAKLVPGLLLEGLILGWVALKFRKAFLGGRTEESRQSALPLGRWLHLAVAWAVLNGLTILGSMYLPDLFAFFHEDSPRRLLLVELAIVPFFLTWILAVLLFAIPSIVLQNRSFWSGIAESVRLFARRPLASFFMAITVLVGPYLLSAAAGKSAEIIAKFRPELIFLVLLAGLAAEIVANFLWMGCSVRLLLDQD